MGDKMFKKLKTLFDKEKTTIGFFKKINYPQKYKEIDSLLDDMPYKDEKFDVAAFDESYIVLHQTSIGSYTTYDHPGIRNKYNTNVKEKTCSCKDWTNTRKHYELFDPRRLCKHLIQELQDSDIQLHYPYYQQEIVFYKNNERGFKRNIDEIIDLSKFGLMVFVSEWCDVFDIEGNRYGFKFDWETGNKIWANGIAPKGYQEVEKIFQNNFIQPHYMSKDELQEIGRWLEKNRGYSKCKFTIELETMYILPPGVLCYRTMDVDCGLAYEVSEFYCNKDYLRIDYLNHDSDYFKRLKPSFDSDAFTKWQNYKDPYIEQQKIDEEKDKIRSKGFVLDGDVENFYCQPENITIDGYAIEEKLLSKYPNISKRTFHMRLKKLGILNKPNHKWIFTEKGLEYGYNLIIRYTYNQDIQEFPCFYCDASSKEFIKYSQTISTEYGDILYPDCIALYDISKFKQLMELINNAL
jgi:hypothetical protein